MTQKKSLRIKEMYLSLQGEGPSIGKRTAFLRLAGCSLRCRYCDSAHAFSGGKDLGVDNILVTLKAWNRPLLLVTGGEPLDQENTLFFLRAFVAEGFEVELETGGHRPIERVPDEVRVLLDLKTPGSGMVEKNLWSNLEHLKSRDIVKIVITSREDYLWARELFWERLGELKAEIFFSRAFPVSPDDRGSEAYPGLEARDLAEWILEDALPLRLQLQQHRLLWGEARGR
jgi:7-carboxy-7-deazaguanine synthase